MLFSGVSRSAAAAAGDKPPALYCDAIRHGAVGRNIDRADLRRRLWIGNAQDIDCSRLRIERFGHERRTAGDSVGSA